MRTEDNIARIDRCINNARQPLEANQVNLFLQLVKRYARAAPRIDFSIKEWIRLFPDNLVKTPIGLIKFGENQCLKIIGKNRTHQFRMIKPTLRNPDIVVYETEEHMTGTAERAGKILFIKTFIDDEKRMVHFESVTIRRDLLEISISSHIIKNDRALGMKLKKNRVVYMRKALSSVNSEGRLADQSETVPDLVPAQEANAFSNCKDKE